MIFDGLLGTVAGILDKWLSKLPAIDTNWPFAESFALIAKYLALMWKLFPPIETCLLILAAGIAVECLVIAFYWIMWLVKKIPLIG